MGRPTQTLIGKKARKAILDGVNAIYIPVSKTFGPEGKNALLYRTFNRGSRITNDGVTVSECQEPQNIFVRLAAQAFKEASKKTNEKAGDGTTLTSILGGVLFNGVYKLLNEGESEFTTKQSVSIISLKRKILESAVKIKQAIKDSAKKVETLEELENIASVSVEDKELGKIIAKMAWEVGVDGAIDVTEGYKGEIETEVIQGMRFPAKVAAKAFVNNPARYEMVAEDCSVFITNYGMDNAAEIAQVFQGLNKATSKIIIIAPSFSDNVLVNMVNATKAGFFMFPVKVPSLRTEQFEDLAIYCGATFIDKNKGKHLRNAKAEDLGFLEKLIVKDTELREDAIATGGKGTRQEFKQEKGQEVKIISPLLERIEVLKGQAAEESSDPRKKLLERRIGSMASSIGVIRVGDSTQASSLYRKLKIEDAVYASKAALRGGYVEGGGLCLKKIAEGLPEDDIMRSVLLAPYEQIQSSYENGIAIGNDIIDPAEAVYYAVDHAVSVVANLITCEIITSEIEAVEMGEGFVMMAKMMGELSITMKRHLGLLKESEEESERDRLNGFTENETVYFDGQNL